MTKKTIEVHLCDDCGREIRGQAAGILLAAGCALLGDDVRPLVTGETRAMCNACFKRAHPQFVTVRVETKEVVRVVYETAHDNGGRATGRPLPGFVTASLVKGGAWC